MKWFDLPHRQKAGSNSVIITEREGAQIELAAVSELLNVLFFKSVASPETESFKTVIGIGVKLPG